MVLVWTRGMQQVRAPVWSSVQCLLAHAHHKERSMRGRTLLASTMRRVGEWHPPQLIVQDSLPY
jgi:hypothetical protein